MAKAQSKYHYESRALKQAVSDAFKQSSYQLKGSAVAKESGDDGKRKVIIIKK